VVGRAGALVPAGFPRCLRCPLRATGTPADCARCVEASLPPRDHRCPTCARRLGGDGEACRNPICSWDYRSFRRLHAIYPKTGAVDRILKALKYGGRTEWAPILGRLVLGWLDSHLSPGDYDLIVANPTEAGRAVHHTELILEAAAREAAARDTATRDGGTRDTATRDGGTRDTGTRDGGARDSGAGTWPIRPRALVKSGPTDQSGRTGTNWHTKWEAAKALRGVVMPAPGVAFAGRRVLIFDDVATSGGQLQVLGELLAGWGAARIDGLVLARTGG
jgi:predicted amidophosphoribosyltransferase